MKIFIRGTLAALALGLVGAVGAEAQIESHALYPEYACATVDLSGSADCRGWFSGNNEGESAPAEELVIDYINTQWGGQLGYTVTDGSTTDEGSSSGPFSDWGTNLNTGTLNFDSPIYGNFVVALKAGQQFSLYLFTGADGLTSLDFNTSGAPSGNALSHATLYGGEYSVPEPGMLLLLGTGLLGIGVARRREEDVI